MWRERGGGGASLLRFSAETKLRNAALTLKLGLELAHTAREHAPQILVGAKVEIFAHVRVRVLGGIAHRRREFGVVRELRREE